MVTPPRPARAAYRPPEMAKYLLANETCVALVRRHWAMILPQTLTIVITWTLWAIVLAARPPAVLSDIATMFFVFSAAWFGWIALDWREEVLAVTDKRVLLVTGLLTKRLAVMPLSKVTDMTFERSPAGRVLGYGTFVMESAGQAQALSRIEFVRKPDQLYHRLSQQLFGGGVPSLTAPEPDRQSRDPLAAAHTVRLPDISPRGPS